ncbi:MAG: hypothetical protein JWM76_4177 [Pseudonocardiales bacterium]|nr:hypothetical protein [Pseudonocardiales bacterium]
MTAAYSERYRRPAGHRPQTARLRDERQAIRLAPHPIDVLIESRREVWESSVDELDASVALEADGINDVVAMGRYRAQGVNDLARQLVDRVPVRFKEPLVAETTPAVAFVRLAFRGLLFAIPGLFYLVIARMDRTTAAAYTLIGSMLFGWGLSQAVAVIAYRVSGRGSWRCAAVALRSYLVSAVLLTVAALALSIYFGHTALVAMALGQILYVLAATVLLFYSSDRLLALALVPGAAVSILYLFHLPIAPSVAIAAGVISIACALAAACYRATVAAAAAEKEPADNPRLADVKASLPFVIYGVLSGVAVAYIPVRVLLRPPSDRVHPIDLTIVPLVVSMGCAEIELLRLRIAGGRLMRASYRLSQYQRQAARLITIAQVRLVLVLTGTSIVFGVIMAATSGFNRRDLTLLLSYMTLGTALLAALVLVAVNRVHVALAGFWCTGVIAAIAVIVSHLIGRSPNVEAGYLAVCLVLLVTMTLLAARVLRDPIALA